MNDYKIPWDELSGEANLKGRYKVSFFIDIDEADNVTIGDLHQSLAAGFSDDPGLSKLSHLDMEKTDAEGHPLPSGKSFKVGDTVVVTEDVELTAQIDVLNGHYIVGAKNESTIPAGEGTVVIHQGMIARVNKVDGDTVELIDLDAEAAAALKNVDTDEVDDVFVQVDSVILSNNSIEALKGEED